MDVQFSFHSCKFQVQKCKEGTGRVVMWRMGILNSYTMESTFSGTTLGSKSNSHFTCEDLKSLGYHICDTLLDFCDPDHSKFQQCLNELKELLKQKIQKKLSELGREQNTEGTWSDISLSDVESSTSGSDSSQSDGSPMHMLSEEDKDCNEEKKKKKRKKKKLLQTRKERNFLHQKHTLHNTLKHQEDVLAQDLKDSVSSFMQQKHPDTTQEKHPELPLNKQSIPVVECELKIKEPQPLLMTMIPPSPAQQQSLTTSPIKQHPPPFQQPNGENSRQQNAGPSPSAPALGVRRYRSMWWNPEVPSMTLMLRRSLSLKSQSTLDNRNLWNLSQSRSQVLPYREFKWKPLKIDCMLLKTHSEHPTRIRGAPNEIGRKHSSTKRGVAGPKAESAQKEPCVSSHRTMDTE